MAVSLRSILDRVGKGLPCNAKIAQHTPLPPDGDNMEDFDTGTEEYLDLVDVQHLSEKVTKHYEEQVEKQKEAHQKAKQKEFDEAVARKVAETISSANNESTALAN